MHCPKCSSMEHKVIETRVSKDGDSIRRRRECLECSYRFTTRESIIPAELIVVKRDGRREEFLPDKLRTGLKLACWKRPISTGKLDELVAEISAILAEYQEHEIPSETIGELVMERLQRIDEVAYVRFASVYRQFKDIDQFINEIQHLTDKQD